MRDLLGFAPGRLVTDLLWGLLWVTVLYLPFTGALMLTVWLQYGDDTFTRMETLFVDPAGFPVMDAAVWSIIAIVVVLTFAPLNAPAEELVYRGVAQGTLQRVTSSVIAIVAPAALFAIQHIFYAATPAAVLPFVAAFFVWGLGSGLIYRWQRRLMPLMCAHFFVNLFFTLPVLFIPALLTAKGA